MKKYFDLTIFKKTRWIIEADNKEDAIKKFKTFNLSAHQTLYKKTIKKIQGNKPIGKLKWK